MKTQGNTKGFAALMLVLVLIIGLVPTLAFATDEIIAADAKDGAEKLEKEYRDEFDKIKGELDKDGSRKDMDGKKSDKDGWWLLFLLPLIGLLAWLLLRKKSVPVVEECAVAEVEAPVVEVPVAEETVEQIPAASCDNDAFVNEIDNDDDTVVYEFSDDEIMADTDVADVDEETIA